MFIIPNLILLRLYHSIFWECNLFTIDNLDNDHESQPINICQVDKKNIKYPQKPAAIIDYCMNYCINYMSTYFFRAKYW